MGSRLDLMRLQLEHAHRVMADNLRGVTLGEALYIPPGGYRSILGTLKHASGWSHVYRSYAFDPEPRHWQEVDWPRGLRHMVVQSQEYLDEVVAWFHLAHARWMSDLSTIDDEDLDEPHRLHWGQLAPLSEIITMIAAHHVYHAGELNQVLSICRGEAWEEGEEVEENNISTLGHRVRPPWKA